MKNIFLGANWKMNATPQGALLSDTIFRSQKNVEVVVFPTFVDLATCIASQYVCVGAQCARAEEKGAFTGDVSMTQIKAMGCTHVLCGHSERRQLHFESDDVIANQVLCAQKVGLIPILCIGETDTERSMGTTHDVLRKQLSQCGHAMLQNSIVAYEPVWAIGTGKTPTSAEAQKTHAFIRSLLPSPSIRILYGGSMNAKNAASFLQEKDIDGGLIGGASLKSDEFGMIVSAALS